MGRSNPDSRSTDSISFGCLPCSPHLPTQRPECNGYISRIKKSSPDVACQVSGEGANTAVRSATTADGHHVAAAATAESAGGGMFNVTTVVSEFASEGLLMNVADSVLGKQTVITGSMPVKSA